MGGKLNPTPELRHSSCNITGEAFIYSLDSGQHSASLQPNYHLNTKTASAWEITVHTTVGELTCFSRVDSSIRNTF